MPSFRCLPFTLLLPLAASNVALPPQEGNVRAQFEALDQKRDTAGIVAGHRVAAVQDLERRQRVALEIRGPLAALHTFRPIVPVGTLAPFLYRHG